MKFGENLLNITMLRQKQTKSSGNDFNAKEMMKRTKIFYEKLSVDNNDKMIKELDVIFGQNNVININHEVESDVITFVNEERGAG